MNEPTIQDRLTGSFRQAQQAILEVVTQAGHLAALSGANENQVHLVIQQCYQNAQQLQRQTQAQTLGQSQTWSQPQLAGQGTFGSPQGPYSS